MDDVLWGGVDVLSTGQDITSLRKMVLVSVMRRHFQAGDSIVGLDSLATLLAKLPSHDLSTVADIAKGKTGIKDAKPGPYPLVVTAEARSECDHFDYEGPAVLIPMVSSTGHGDASLKRIHYQEGQYAVGTILAVVRPLNPAQLSARYLYEYLSAFKDELLVSRMVGTANVSLTVKKLGDVPVPLIPFESQRQIERLMALCDRLEADQADAEAAHAQLVQALLDSLTQATDAADFRASWQRLSEHFHTLFTTEASIDALKQTVLQLAVMGRLVPQADSDMPAAALLRSIKPDWTFEGEWPFDLPTCWAWTRFSDLLDFQGGGQPPKSQFSDTPKQGYVQLIQIRDLGEKPQPVYVTRESVSKFCTTEDILVGRYGASVGKVFWGKEGAYNVALVKMIDRHSVYDKQFLYALLRSPLGQSYFSGISRSAQDGFNKGDVASCPLPVCSLQEQHRIVAKVDELMALCDQLKAQLTEARQRHAQLASVLVEQAVV